MLHVDFKLVYFRLILSYFCYIFEFSFFLVIGASVSEPHTSESNWDFSYFFWRTSFRIS